NKPIVVSNACISGVVAIIIASRLLREGRFQNVIVTGADILSEFVVSGFQSFKAISPEPCKPFDARRDGMSIGEGCGTIVLTLDQQYIPDEHRILVTGCSGSNDANHISGPSMTGEGLYTAIRNALDEADLLPVDIDFISAHGTATPYNDEMEAKALTMARLNNKPVNSLKGYFGHTLGAAGILESVAAIHSMKENLLIKTLGYSEHGVSCELNVVKELIGCEINRCIKTASGFGGCNAAILFEKK
ncbi:MAG: beta-ketoacyl synthase, partial [Bacteroidetes bacterium]|nr:beta-ketoacyl synthase [Bacteroidota bacterium]